MPKRSAYSALSVALALGIAPVAQAQTTLDLSTWQAEEPGFGDWWSEVISAFNEAKERLINARCRRRIGLGRLERLAARQAGLRGARFWVI